MATSTVEDYVKRIYMLQQRVAADALVPLGQVSSVVGVVPGTATTMVKALAESGLVRYEPRSGVRLTSAGEKLALHVLRRHRLVELFLVNVLGFDWSEVDEEAERLEHAISERLIDRIDAHLGHPAYDPHGDPIPTAAGTIELRTTTPLAEAAVGVAMTVAHITDQDAHFLGYAAGRGLTPGVCVIVESVDPLGDSVSVRVAGKTPLTLGRAAAMKIAVQEK
ncbi:MAG TPA: metal-dependent transcriptional regulator [Tepidisphaeraceae bacterium]|jgi:DtxR family Mn-dependent transcriptional regulator